MSGSSAALILPVLMRRWPGAMPTTTIALVMGVPHGAWLMDGGLYQVLSQPKMPRVVSGHRTLFGLINHPMVGGICATLPIWLIDAALVLLPRRGTAAEAVAPVAASDRRFMLMLAVVPAGVPAMVAGLNRIRNIGSLRRRPVVLGRAGYAGAGSSGLFRGTGTLACTELGDDIPVAGLVVLDDPYGRPAAVGSGNEGSFPGATVARAITEGWRQRTGTPLRYVTGSLWLAGNVRFYGEDRPSAFVGDDYLSNPWISAPALVAAGTVLIWNIERNGEDIPAVLRAVFPAAVRQPPIVVNTLRRRHEIGWAIVR